MLYPGGLFAAVCALLASLLWRGAAVGPPDGPPEPQAVVSLGLAWAGLALLPLPGAAPLPGAPDLTTPLGLLLASTLLRLGPGRPAHGWSREVGGRPLLLAAPLLAAAALGADGLLLPAPAPPLAALRWVGLLFAALAFLAGYLLCQAPPARPSSRDMWVAWAADGITRIGWAGVALSVGWSALAGPDTPVWAGPLALAALALGGAAAGRAGGARLAPWGWAALGFGLLAVLLAR